MFFVRFSHFLLTLIFLTIGYAFWQTFAFPDDTRPLDKGRRVVLTPEAVLTQPFQSHRDGLRRVEILFGDFGLKDSDRLTLELRDAECSTVLRHTILSHDSYDSEHTRSFVFASIDNSQDQTYCLALHFQTSRTIKATKGPRLFEDTSAPGIPYTLHDKDVVSTGTHPVMIRPGYVDASFSENQREFFNRVSQYKPFFLKNWYLIGVATFGLILTVLVILLLLREESSETL